MTELIMLVCEEEVREAVGKEDVSSREHEEVPKGGVVSFDVPSDLSSEGALLGLKGVHSARLLQAPETRDTRNSLASADTCFKESFPLYRVSAILNTNFNV